MSGENIKLYCDAMTSRRILVNPTLRSVPSKPLSHVSRLILASLASATPNISFRSALFSGQQFQWSDSTSVGDFIRDAACAANFDRVRPHPDHEIWRAIRGDACCRGPDSCGPNTLPAPPARLC
ncbi:hypothetical protein B0H17DRAFT_1077057 [Mycena rosella]|uniref:Uncharacterized protein n=1 Tax=Mycena rosella TaxID=1033263 RepID=A0AAD7D5X6_MYCRO|nr:hypothetical protein B0H17DRAFT_1077057 [Mycena rosella]